MPWMRFTHDFDFKVNPNVVRAYKAGRVYLVSQDAADRALKAQAAVPAPRRKAANVIR